MNQSYLILPLSSEMLPDLEKKMEELSSGGNSDSQIVMVNLVVEG